MTKPTSANAIGIMGASLGTGNRGVSALGASLVKLLTQSRPGSHAVMLIGRRETTPFPLTVAGKLCSIPVVNFRMSPKSALRDHLLWIALLALLYRFSPFEVWRAALRRRNPWIKTVAEAVLVGDIRGGDSFSDIYGLRGFLLASLPILTVIWVRGSIVLFPQTYGPYKHWLARAVARSILRRSSCILSRDQDSMETVRQLIGSTDRLRFCPDVAFALEPVRPSVPAIDPPLSSSATGPLVGLNVNGLIYNGGYTRRNMFGLKLDYRAMLGRLVDALLKDDSVQILLVPHTFGPADDVESDPQACREVRNALSAENQQRVHLVTYDYDQHEIKGVIGLCDFFVGSRMHSCIAALSQGIPTLGVAYSKKFKGVFESVDAGDWVIDGRTIDADAAVKDVLSYFRRRNEMRAALAGKPERARFLLRDTFARLFTSS
jgi:polysaccharide pyruvyl transferase WcaK-like protein